MINIYLCKKKILQRLQNSIPQHCRIANFYLLILKSFIHKVSICLKIIIVGDSTDHGGYIIFGWPVHNVSAKPIARLGDQAVGEIPLAENGNFKLTLLPPTEAGDGTVPAIDSAAKVKSKVQFKQTGYDHQGSYHNDFVLASMLYSVVKIANTADGWKKWCVQNMQSVLTHLANIRPYSGLPSRPPQLKINANF